MTKTELRQAIHRGLGRAHFEDALAEASALRANAVRLMGRHRMISPALWEELRFDSSEEIRRYAEAHFRKTK